MPGSKDTIEVLPSAKRLINSLRDIGYDLVHAVADLVDNSIAAGASRIEITVRFDGEHSWLRVADDGAGMSGNGITEAMRFGSERDYELNDLGKFGLGLKTASLSQCRRLSVASRQSRETKRVEARQWDLDHVGRKNRWEVFALGPGERSDELVEPLASSTGTVVLWERLDRVLGYKVPWGEKAKAGLLQTTEDLEHHLGMVFHRFLAGETRRKRKLRITVNGNVVQPWDPFARAERHTVAFWSGEFDVQTGDGPGTVKTSMYVLPRKDQFSSDREFQRLSGPAKWNRQQGFYVYRADRMIQSGGWCWMRAADEHTKLARVALDFQPDLDTAFEINVSKARVQLPRDLRDKLEPQVERLAKKAREVYDGAPRTPSAIGTGSSPTPLPSQPEALPVGQNGAVAGRSHGSPIGAATPDTTTHPEEIESSADGRGSAPLDGSIHVVRAGAAVRKAAKASGEEAAFRKIVERLRKDDPEVAHALGW